MYLYRVDLRLYGGHKTVWDTVKATDERDARHKAFKYAIPLYRKARPEFVGVAQMRRLKRVGNQWV